MLYEVITEQIESIREEIGDPSAESSQILSTHLALLEDSMLIDETVRSIRERNNFV